MIKFECETCFQEYKVRDDRAGQVLKCKSCGSKMRVPTGDDDFEDDLYEEEYDAPVRPARKKKSTGSSKKKSSNNSNNPITIIAGVCAFGIAFFVAYTFVGGLFKNKENNDGAPVEVVQNEPKDTSTPVGSNLSNETTQVKEKTSDDDILRSIPNDPTAIDKEIKRLQAKALKYVEQVKTITTREDSDAIQEKMSAIEKRVNELTKKRKIAMAANEKVKLAEKKSKPISQKWTSLVDPPPVVAEWPESSKLKIDLKEIDEDLILPSSFSPFVGLKYKNHRIYKMDIWNLAIEKKVGQISIPRDKNWIVLSPKFKLSADGKHVLLTFINKDSKIAKLATWNTQTGERIAEWDVDPVPTTVSLYEICGTKKAFAKMIRKEGTRYKTILKLWDLTTGKLLKESEVKSSEFNHSNYKISPGGNYLISYNHNEIFIYNLASLELIYKKELVLFIDSNVSHPSLQNIDISADGKELGLLVSGSDTTSVWVTNLESGKSTKEYGIEGNLRNVFSEPSYGGSNLILTPSGDSLLLYGALLVDRKSMRSVWLYHPVPNVIMRNDLFITPHYILAGTDSALKDARGRLKIRRKPRLVSVPLPEKKIVDSLSAYASGNDAFLKEGQQVSIEVKIGKVKFTNIDEVKSILGDVIQERLESEGFQIGEDQPIVFKIEYQEQAGNKLQLTKRGRPSPGNPLGRTATGQTIDSTAAAFKLSWVEKATKRTLWSKQALVNPRFLILRDATAEEAREQMFEGLQNRLMAESIPYFIPKDKNLSMLPGETQLPE